MFLLMGMTVQNGILESIQLLNGWKLADTAMTFAHYQISY